MRCSLGMFERVHERFRAWLPRRQVPNDDCRARGMRQVGRLLPERLSVGDRGCRNQNERGRKPREMSGSMLQVRAERYRQ